MGNGQAEAITRLVNLTPHPIVVRAADGRILRTFAAANTPVRIAAKSSPVARIDDVPIVDVVYGSTLLPEPQVGVGFIVSTPIASAYPERRDLFVPVDLERLPDGTVIGCRALGRIEFRGSIRPNRHER